jgi:hypothetical protein
LLTCVQPHEEQEKFYSTSLVMNVFRRMHLVVVLMIQLMPRLTDATRIVLFSSARGMKSKPEKIPLFNGQIPVQTLACCPGV